MMESQPGPVSIYSFPVAPSRGACPRKAPWLPPFIAPGPDTARCTERVLPEAEAEGRKLSVEVWLAHFKTQVYSV